MADEEKRIWGIHTKDDNIVGLSNICYTPSNKFL